MAFIFWLLSAIFLILGLAKNEGSYLITGGIFSVTFVIQNFIEEARRNRTHKKK